MKKLLPKVYPLALFLVFAPLVWGGNIKIAILDTGFCPSQLVISSPKIIIKKVVDATLSVKLKCSGKERMHRLRMHGQKVLQNFLNNIEAKKLGENKIEILPIIIFDLAGVQKLAYWEKGLKMASGSDVLISAAGLPVLNRKNLPQLNHLIFLSVGSIQGQIGQETQLWPQFLGERDELVFLIGSYTEGIRPGTGIYHHQLLYQREIDYYFPSSSTDKSFHGSSFSVGVALGRAVSLCSGQIISKKNSLVRECLKKLSREVSISPAKGRQVMTY